MLTISEYSVERVKDPFRILAGERYEFLLDLALEEEDELYSEHGVYVKAIFKVIGEESGIVSYDLIERVTNRYLAFDLEPDEETDIAAFCKERYGEAE